MFHYINILLDDIRIILTLFILRTRDTTGLKFYHVFILCILLVNEWIFNAIAMHFNEIDLLFQETLKYQRHVENYKESLTKDITPFGLQLKKKAAISAISADFNNQWNNMLKGTERKLLNLLLKEVNEISNETNKKFDE